MSINQRNVIERLTTKINLRWHCLCTEMKKKVKSLILIFALGELPKPVKHFLNSFQIFVFCLGFLIVLSFFRKVCLELNYNVRTSK
jgi:hypothetical protein